MYSVRMANGDAIYEDTQEHIKISIPEESFLNLIEVSEPAEILWPQEYKRALEQPIESETLDSIAKNSKSVAIIVSDATRGVPTSKVLPLVIEQLHKAGVKDEQITTVVGIGVHRPATKDEIIQIVGHEYAGRLKVINHEPYNEQELVYLGQTSFGTPVEVNKTVYNADIRIAIGKVEPHEFAGFSGGRKSVLPGIASEKTIQINHRPEMLLHEGARPGALDGNPVSEDMVESANMLRLDFIVNFVLNSQGNPVGIFAGNFIDAHKKAVDFMRTFCQVKLKEKPDIIVTTPGYPLNIDFYQSIKPLIALAPVMAENSVLVLYSACPDGFNSEDMLVPYKRAHNLNDVIDYLMKNYKIQMDHSLLLCKIMQKKIKVVAYSPNIDKNTLRKIFIEPADSMQDALKEAFDITGKSHPKVLFFPQPQRTLPVLV